MSDEKEPSLDEKSIHIHDAVQVQNIHGSKQLATATLEAPPKLLSKKMCFLYLMCVAPFMCGTMSGYDSSVMGSFLVEKSFQDLFGAKVNGFEAGYITAMYQIGGVCSIPFIGESMDRFGRRFGIFIGCFFTIIGAIIQGTSASSAALGQFLGGRFLLGFGATLAQAAGSTYTVEIAHPLYRGLLSGGQSSMQNFGSLLAAVVTLGTVGFAGNAAWLVPTWTQLVCPGIACLLVWFQPETPRWLYAHNKQESAIDFLIQYHGDGDRENPYVRLEIAEFEEQLDLDGADKKWWDYRVLFKTRSQRYRLANSLMIGFWGALSNGGISYYSGAFYNSAGITNARTVLTFNVWQSIMCAAASFIGSPMSDRVGRRSLLLVTLVGMGLTWAAVAVGTALVEQDPSNSAAAKAGIAFYFLFTFVFCIGITPLQGVYAVEVFSFEQRAKGVGFSNFAVNAVNLINQFATPIALAKIGWKTYIVFCIWNFVEFVISYFWSVETKNFTLEELDDIFESANPRKASTRKREVIVEG